MQVTSNIVGADRVAKTLTNLPRSTQNKALRPALRAGGAIIRDAAISNLKAVTSPDSTGIGAKSIRLYSLKQSRGRLRVAVSVKRGAVNQKKIVNGQPVRVGLYLSVLEYGKKNQAPRSWIRKAAREKTSEVNAVVARESAKNLNLAVQDAKR